MSIRGIIKRISLAIHVLQGRGLIYNVTLDKELSLAEGQRNVWIIDLIRIGNGRDVGISTRKRKGKTNV